MANKRIRKKHANAWGCCPLCGKTLSADPRQRVIGSTGRGICANCAAIAGHILNTRAGDTQKTQKHAEMPFFLPGDLLSEVDKSIIGQEEAKRAVVSVLWKQLLRVRNGVDIPNPGLLLYGPTGCGKTALVRAASKAAGLPFIAFDATTITEAGYRGRDAEEMVTELVKVSEDIQQASHGVIFVDEVDKLAAADGNEYRAAYSRGTQHALLKLVEGKELRVHGKTISTAGILFIYGGAFSAMRREREAQYLVHPIGFDREARLADDSHFTIADFTRHGMEPELMGRICRCVEMNALCESDLRRILLESDLSSYRQYQAFFHKHGKDLSMSEEEISKLIQRAMQRGTGARALHALVEEWVQPKLWELAGAWAG